jgi:hypothetical protein
LEQQGRSIEHAVFGLGERVLGAGKPAFAAEHTALSLG